VTTAETTDQDVCCHTGEPKTAEGCHGADASAPAAAAVDNASTAPDAALPAGASDLGLVAVAASVTTVEAEADLDGGCCGGGGCS
jgi:hypothetical protein